jgi:hypothetical protein
MEGTEKAPLAIEGKKRSGKLRFSAPFSLS